LGDETQIGGKQFKLTNGDFMYLDKIRGASVGDKLLFPKVLLLGNNEETVVGRPWVPGAGVLAAVEQQTRDVKQHVFKMKRRKGYRKFEGFRTVRASPESCFVCLLKVQHSLVAHRGPKSSSNRRCLNRSGGEGRPSRTCLHKRISLSPDRRRPEWRFGNPSRRCVFVRTTFQKKVWLGAFYWMLMEKAAGWASLWFIWAVAWFSSRAHLTRKRPLRP